MSNSQVPEQLELFPGTKFSIERAVVMNTEYDSGDLGWTEKLNDAVYGDGFEFEE